MKLVFAHDHKLRKIDGKYYTTGGLSDHITERYLRFFESVTILCRVIEKQPEDKKLFEIKNPAVKVIEVSSGSLILSKEGKKRIEKEISDTDGLIARLPSWIGRYAVGMAEKYRIPYLTELVACPWDGYWNHSLKGKMTAPWMTITTRNIVENSPYTVYVTQKFLQNRYPCKGKQLACSDVELDGVEEQLSAVRKNRIETMGERLTVIGTLAQTDVRYKGHTDVLQALKILKQSGQYYLYRIAGNGSTGRLEKIANSLGIRDQVMFDGNLSRKEVFQWLDRVDIYIQPSRQEGLPRAVVEAMSRGCPVIGTNTGGIPELVDEAYRYRKGKYEQLAEQIQKMERQNLYQIAKRNLAVAKEYEKEKLNRKRDMFYGEFAERCRKRSIGTDG